MATERLTSGSQLRLLVLVVIGAAVIILAIQNPETIKVKFLTFEAQMPQFGLILASLALGFVAGHIVAHVHRKKP